MASPLRGRSVEERVIRLGLDDAGRGGVALVGPPGAGTSRLLAVAVDHASAHGWHVRTARATPASQGTPFGAIDHAVAPTDVEDAPATGGWDQRLLERRMRRDAVGARVLLAVDDAHWLDRASIEFIERLGSREWVRVAVALHDLPGSTGEVPTPAMRLIEIEVAPVERSVHDAMLDDALGGLVTERVRDQLWNLTLGRPRDLQIVFEALSPAGAAPGLHSLGDPDGLRLDAPGLRAVAAAELRDLNASAREAFEVVAGESSVPLPVVLSVIDADDLERLERAGLLEECEHPEHGAPIVRIARPIIGAAIAGRLSPATRRRHAALLAACHPPIDAWWRWRHAAWTEAAGLAHGPVDVGAVRGALDHLDRAVAEQLCRSAVAADPDDFAARMLLAECLRRGGRSQDALDALDAAWNRAASDDERARVAVLRAQVVTLLDADPTAALRWLDTALDEVVAPAAVARLEHEREFISSFLGPVPSVTRRAPPIDDGSGDTLVGDLLAAALLQVLHLDVDGVDDLLRRCRERTDSAEVLEPMVDARIAVVRHLADIGRGRVGAAHRRAHHDLADAVRRGEPCGLWAVPVVFSGPLVGDLDGAVAAAIDADESLQRVDPYGLRPFTAGLGATAMLQAGRTDLADALAPSSQGADPRIGRMTTRRNDAWRMIRAGDARGAASSAHDAGRTAITAGHRLWGAVALHEPARWGVAESVVDDLAALCLEAPTPLTNALHAHARAVAGGGGGDLDVCAERLAAMGCRVLAAEAAAQAARRHGDRRAATRARTRADLWWTSCSGAQVVEPGPSGLTARQREITRLAALGLSTRVIAEQLVLSPRTVDNHLSSAYRSLGVGGRDELAMVLGPALVP